MADKILITDGKPFLKLGKKVPFAEGLNIPLKEDQFASSYKAKEVNGKQIILAVVIDGVNYEVDIEVGKIDDAQETVIETEERKVNIKYEDGDLLVNWNDKKVRFRPRRHGRPFAIIWRQLPDAFEHMNEYKVEAELIDGDITAITYDGTTYIDIFAKAPYNFVPLNKKIVTAQPLPDFDKFYETDKRLESGDKRRCSGSIDLCITTKTPFFIRGEGEKFFQISEQVAIPGSSLRGLFRNLVEIVTYSALNDINDDRLFFRAVYEKSSLGNLYQKIFINKEDRTPQLELLSYKVKSGWLKKDGESSYILYPSQHDSEDRQFYKANGDFKNNGRDFEIGYWTNNKTVWNKRGPLIPLFSYKKVYFNLSPATIIPEKNKNTFSLCYNEIRAWLAEIDDPGCSLHEAYLVSTGEISKKHYQWVINPPDLSQPKQVADAVALYKQDANRDEKTHLLSLVEIDAGKRFPCFYLEEDGNVLEIGHTGLFRKAYSNTITQAVLQAENNGVNLAEAIFGSTEKACRVYFEDACLDKAVEQQVRDELSVLQVLGSPKPTTFQHYLKQPFGYKTPFNKLQHWDSIGSSIKGHKLYWHRPNKNEDKSHWQLNTFEIRKKDFFRFLTEVKEISNPENELLPFQQQFFLYMGNGDDEKMVIQKAALNNEKFGQLIINFFNLENQLEKKYKIKKPQSAIASCIVNQVAFTSRIRFENLTTEELGALLFVLQLPEGCNHKLGMGKPLGLGSVEIKPSLTIIDRQQRYKTLFDGAKWNTGEESDNDLDKYKNVFAQYIDMKLNNRQVIDKKFTYKDLWNIGRLKQLKTMLTFEHDEFKGKGDEWLERTRYLQITTGNNEYRNRPVLPEPDEVIRK